MTPAAEPIPSLTRLQRLGMGAYNAFWLPALPLLALSSKLRKGFGKRMVPDRWIADEGWQDVWIQSASAGEARLSWEIARHLDAGRTMNLLCTTNTPQGMEILRDCETWSDSSHSSVVVNTTWFPFDSTSLMRRALNLVLPKVVVLLETELWPGLLLACKREDVPVLVVNGRMRAKSLAGYLSLGRLFRTVAPTRVLAVSDADAARYGALFGQDRVMAMPNIKFDTFARALEQAQGQEHPPPEFAPILPKDAPFLVLGSTRREEEHQVLSLIKILLRERPGVCIGLFPRHMNRVLPWERMLHRAGISFTARSLASTPVPSGHVILWDRFGELHQAYSLASAVFVGGGLAPKGGQNFLEALAHGRIPVIGPDWSNFHWVGRDILAQDLVRVGKDVDQVARHLMDLLDSHPATAEVTSRTMEYVASRRGGARQAALEITSYLD